MIPRFASLLLAAALAANAADAVPAAGAAPAAAPAAAPTTALPAEAVKPGADKPAAKPTDENSKLTEEEKWVFEPVTGRVDPFYDRKIQMQLEQKIVGPDDSSPNGVWPQGEKAKDYAKALMQKVESAIVAKKWDEAIKTCDQAIKQLSKDNGNDEAQALIEKFKRYRTQAEEAKTYEEALAKFDALDLRIEGILWSPEGSLAVINGEPRARGVNERVKDCVIINIDTNRVDFLFHYNRRRFEFQRYVGEDAKTSAKKEDGR